MIPVIKWVGGKTRLLPEIVARMPKAYGHYFEPFAGGAALFFHLEPAKATISDFNDDLVELYRAIRDNTEKVIRHARKLQREHSPSFYYVVRDRWNAKTWIHRPEKRAAEFLYLNRTCFNGLWRVNREGKFNVPIGRYADPQICNPSALRAAATLLLNTAVLNQDFSDSTAAAVRGDFVYMDPPYDPLSETSSFTGYGFGGFSWQSQERLADRVRVLAQGGVNVMVSNNDTPRIRKLYKGFKIDRVMCGRSVSSKATKRGKVAEVIITTYRRAR